MANSNFVVHNGLTVGPLTINATTGDISTPGNVTLTGSGVVTGPAAAGTLTGATLASGVTASSLTSVGTLTALSVTGNVGAGNVNATNFTGTLLTASQPNITTLGGVTSIGASGTTTLTGILQTAAQTNVTSLGTLTSLGVGAITTTGTLALNAAGGLTTNQTTFLLANATATTLNIGGAATTLNIGATTGTLNLNNATTAIKGNLTITGNLTINGTTTTVNSTTLDVDDLNITVAKGAASAAAANGAGLTVDGASATILYTSATDTWNFNKNIVGTLSTAAQTNVTSLGTLTALAVSGAITVNSGNAVTAIINGGTNGVGNVGSSGTGFNTVFALATSANYADLAENYQADTAYAPGTVVHFGGEFEVTLCDTDGCTRVAGVVSTNPAHLMNTGLTGANVVAVALAGRVPCQVQGTVYKGDLMVSAGNGRARAEANPRVGSIIGKALANSEGDTTIEVVVGIR